MGYSAGPVDIKGERSFQTGVMPLTREAFLEAVEKYADTVFRAALSVTLSREDAEDATQETYLKLWRADRGFESPDHLRFWLIHVAVNEARRSHRWRRRVVPLEALGEAPFETPEETGLYEAVAALPEKYRVPIFLHYYEDMTVREISKIVGAPESTVQTRLARGRERLEKALKEEE